MNFRSTAVYWRYPSFGRSSCEIMPLHIHDDRAMVRVVSPLDKSSKGVTGVSQRRSGAGVDQRLDGHGDRPDVLLV